MRKASVGKLLRITPHQIRLSYFSRYFIGIDDRNIFGDRRSQKWFSRCRWDRQLHISWGGSCLLFKDFNMSVRVFRHDDIILAEIDGQTF